jgi:hypothetical protein
VETAVSLYEHAFLSGQRRLTLIAPPAIDPLRNVPLAIPPETWQRVQREFKLAREAYAREWNRFFTLYVRRRVVGRAPEELGKNASDEEVEAVRLAGGRPALYELFLGRIEDDACRIQLVDWDDFERDIRENGMIKAVLGEEVLL